MRSRATLLLWLGALAALSGILSAGRSVRPPEPPGVEPRREPSEPPLPRGAIARLVPSPVEFSRPPKLDGIGEARYLAFSPDGKRLAVGYYSTHPVVIFDASTGKELVKPGRVTIPSYHVPATPPRPYHLSGSVAFVNGGREILSSSPVYRWDAATGRPLSQGMYNTPQVLPLGDGREMLARGNWAGDFQAHFLVIDTTTWRPVRELGVYKERIDGWAVRPDGTRLVAHAGGGSEPPAVTLWDLSAGKEVRRLVWHNFGLSGAEFTPDGKHVITVSMDSTVAVWRAEDGALVRTIGRRMTRRDSSPWRPFFTCLDVAPVGRLAAAGVMTARDGSRYDVVLWDIGSDEELLRLQAGEHAHPGRISGVAFSPDGRRLATGGAEGSVLVWDLAALGLVKP